jgi:hypothetical protein
MAGLDPAIHVVPRVVAVVLRHGVDVNRQVAKNAKKLISLGVLGDLAV